MKRIGMGEGAALRFIKEFDFSGVSIWRVWRGAIGRYPWTSDLSQSAIWGKSITSIRLVI
jgi:hypothetical protein